ncbi:MAG TPA: hypothetical protein VIS74_03790, partial [Chthoniobacterales bacterium]
MASEETLPGAADSPSITVSKENAGSEAAPPPAPSEPAEVGVPNRNNFFLPDFDSYGQSFFEREGLKFRAGPVHFRMSLGVGLEYNDNIFGSYLDPVSDTIAHVTPSFQFGIGDFNAKAEEYLLLKYRPSFDYYQSQTQQNRVNQNLEITGQTTFSRYSTALDLNFQTNSSPNATQSGGQEYSTLNFNWDNRYYLGSKTFARALVGANIQQSENDNNYQTFSISPQVGYEYSPKTTLFFGPYAGISYVGNGGSQTFQGLTVGINYSNLRKLKFSGTFGVQARQYDGQDTTGASNFITPVFNLGMTYDATETTSLRLMLLRDVQLSDVQRGL